MGERKHSDYYWNDGGSAINGSCGGFNVRLNFRTELGSNLPLGVCRLCGGYDAYRDGVCRVKVQDGFGEVRYYRCHRCDGTGKEPPVWVSDATWWKPWTWMAGHYEVKHG